MGRALVIPMASSVAGIPRKHERGTRSNRIARLMRVVLRAGNFV